MKEYMRVSLLVLAGLIVILVLSLSAKSIFAAKSTDVSSGSVSGNYVATTTPSGSNTGTATIQDGVQTATLKVVGSNYVLTPSVFKKGVPVKITADVNSMPGCSKAFTIPTFKILKFISASDNVIEFTPDQSGTFKMACTMNMYTGTFSVTDDGTTATLAAANANQPAATKPSTASSGGTCGVSTGGCGCGMMRAST